MPDVPSYRTDPDSAFANRLEVALLERLVAPSTIEVEMPPVTPLHELDSAAHHMSKKRRTGRIVTVAVAAAVAAAAVVGLVLATNSNDAGPADTGVDTSGIDTTRVTTTAVDTTLVDTTAVDTTAVAPMVAFVGEWRSEDPDGSQLALEIRAAADGVYEVAYHADAAAVCSGAPATMTGTGPIDPSGALVVPQPIFTCDDGSTPDASSGPPSPEQRADVRFVYDPVHDTLRDGEFTWWRPSPGIVALDPAAMWPQTSLADLAEARDLADAGDPANPWQLEWSEVVDRFLREKLGWEAFVAWPFSDTAHVDGEDFHGYYGLEYVRCAPGTTNALYPNEDGDGSCAPTIDDVRYERVWLNARQFDRLWVVTDWQTKAPAQQAVPPSDAERAALVEPFLAARVAGHGAEHLLADDEAIPLLYATSAGAHYERFEFAVSGQPYWPDGRVKLTVRLFADGGQAVVDQDFMLTRDGAGGFALAYEDGRGAGTRENGHPLPVPYSFLGGRVTFAAGHPWVSTNDGSSSAMTTLAYEHSSDDSSGLVVLADPVPVDAHCKAGAAPADAGDLARAIRADPDFVVTEPTSVLIGGVEALMMDWAPAAGAIGCFGDPVPWIFTEWNPRTRDRMRIYLVDLPGGSPRTLAIVVYGDAETFDQVLEAAKPVIGSFTFD